MRLSIAIAALGVTRQSLEETTYQVTCAENLGSFPTTLYNIYLMNCELEFFIASWVIWKSKL